MKLRIVFCVLLVVSSMMIGSFVYADDLVIESIGINLLASECKYEWQATIRNNSNATVNGQLISVQAYQGDGQGGWTPAGGSVLGNLAPNQTVTKTSKFMRDPNRTEIKVCLYANSALITESIVPLPSENASDLEIIDGQFSATGYWVDVRNNDPTYPSSKITTQCSKMQSSNPGSYVPCGGFTIECIKPNEVFRQTGSGQPGYDIFRMQLRRGGVLATERVFGELPPEQTEETSEGTSTGMPVKIMPDKMRAKGMSDNSKALKNQAIGTTKAADTVPVPTETKTVKPKIPVPDPAPVESNPLDVFKNKAATSAPQQNIKSKSMEDEFGGGSFYKGTDF